MFGSRQRRKGKVVDGTLPNKKPNRHRIQAYGLPPLRYPNLNGALDASSVKRATLEKHQADWAKYFEEIFMEKV